MITIYKNNKNDTRGKPDLSGYYELEFKIAKPSKILTKRGDFIIETINFGLFTVHYTIYKLYKKGIK